MKTYEITNLVIRQATCSMTSAMNEYHMFEENILSSVKNQYSKFMEENNWLSMII